MSYSADELEILNAYRRTGVQRELLLYFTYSFGITTRVVALSVRGHKCPSDDSLYPDLFFDPRIISEPTVSRSVSVDDSGRGEAFGKLNISDIDIDNSDEKYSFLPFDANTNDTEILGYVGCPLQTGKTSIESPTVGFVQVFKGKIAGVSWKEGIITLQIDVDDIVKDDDLLFDPDDVYGESNKTKPAIFGTVYRFTPPLTDPLALEYTLSSNSYGSEDPVQSIVDVRDRGSVLSGTQYTLFPSTGLLTLKDPADNPIQVGGIVGIRAESVTALSPVVGDRSSATALMYLLLDKYAGHSSPLFYDNENQTTDPSLAKDYWHHRAIGASTVSGFVAGDGWIEKCSDAIEQLARTANGFVFVGPKGEFRLGHYLPDISQLSFDAPSGSSNPGIVTHEIDYDYDVEDGSLKVDRVTKSIWKWKIGVSKSWGVLRESEVAGAAIDDTDDLISEYRYTYRQESAVASFFNDAVEAEVETLRYETTFDAPNPADFFTSSDFLYNLFQNPLSEVEFITYKDAFEIFPGEMTNFSNSPVNSVTEAVVVISTVDYLLQAKTKVKVLSI